jgi:hypothetical protein
MCPLGGAGHPRYISLAGIKKIGIISGGYPWFEKSF